MERPKLSYVCVCVKYVYICTHVFMYISHGVTICVYTYIIYIYIYIQYIYIHTDMDIDTSNIECTYIEIRTYIHTYIHTYIEQTCDIAAYFHAAAANVGACEPYHLTACANEVLTDRRPTCRQHRFGRTGCREREVVRGDNPA